MRQRTVSKEREISKHKDHIIFSDNDNESNMENNFNNINGPPPSISISSSIPSFDIDKAASCIAYSFCSISMILGNKYIASSASGSQGVNHGLSVLPGEQKHFEEREQLVSPSSSFLPHPFLLLFLYFSFFGFNFVCDFLQVLSAYFIFIFINNVCLILTNKLSSVAFQNFVSIILLEVLRGSNLVSYNRSLSFNQMQLILPLSLCFVGMLLTGYMCLKVLMMMICDNG